MHNFSGKWDPQILPWICFPIWRIKRPPFFRKIAHALKKNAQTNHDRHHNKQTKQQTNQERKKPINKPTKKERKKETNKQTNQPTNLLLPFPPKKTCNFMPLHTCGKPSSRTPSTIHHHLHLALPSARMAAKAPPEAWICSTSLQGAESAATTHVVENGNPQNARGGRVWKLGEFFEELVCFPQVFLDDLLFRISRNQFWKVSTIYKKAFDIATKFWIEWVV